MTKENEGYFLMPKSELKKISDKMELIVNYFKNGQLKEKFVGEYVTEEEVQALLCLSRTSLWNLRKNNVIKSVKLSNRVYYHLPTLKEYMDKHLK
jgi:hypothetical protein